MREFSIHLLSVPLPSPLDILVPFRRIVTVNEREGVTAGLEIFADRSRDPVSRNQQLRKKHLQAALVEYIRLCGSFFLTVFPRHCFAARLLPLFLIA